MSKIIVLGAGPIGATTATMYAERGDEVVVVTRSGSGPEVPPGAAGSIRRVAMDATDPALVALATGAAVIVNAINLPYGQWAQGWPPIHRAILSLAEQTGAVLALAGNFYMYAAGANPLTPDLPLDPPSKKGAIRAGMWTELVEAHRAGRIRAVELRASDYLGHQVTDRFAAHAGPRLADPVLQGKRAWVVGEPDAPHTWTAVDDIGRTIVTLAQDERAWGHAWHVPSAAPRTLRELAGDYARVGGAATAKLSRIPVIALRLTGLVMPVMGEIVETLHQHTAPFIATHDATTAVFGLEPTPWEETIRGVVAARRAALAEGDAAAVTVGARR